MSASLHGLINLLKPPGMTSHDVVGYARRFLGRKIGHTGTLDPLAAGVLVITVGAATRLSEFLASDDKAYRAEITLGVETDTLDFEGDITDKRDASSVSAEAVREGLRGLTGPVEMLPPMYSAVKQGGRKLYELARKGQDIERQPRHVTVSQFDLVRFEPGSRARCLCDIECSKGTYVRSLAQLLGERLEVGGCLSFLLRTRQGACGLADSVTLEELALLSESGRLEEALVPLAKAPWGVATTQISAAGADSLRHGQAVECGAAGAVGEMVLVLCGEEAVCLAEISVANGRPALQPKKVFPAADGSEE